MNSFQKNRTVFLLSLAGAVAVFHRTSFTELASLLGQDGSLSTSALAWVGAAFFWAYLGFQIPAGVLVDAAGAERVSALGSAAMAVGAGLFAAVSSPWLLAGARALIAGGAICVYLALVAYCGHTYGSRSSPVLGRALMIGNIGGMFAGVPLNDVLEHLTWRQTWWVLAIMSALVCAATTYIAPKERHHTNLRAAVRNAIPPFLVSLRHQDVYLAAGALAGLAGAFRAFAGFGLHLQAVSLGIGRAAEGSIVSAMVGGFTIGFVFWGQMGDHVKMRNSIVEKVPLAAVALWEWVLFLPPANPWIYGVWLFVVGFLCAVFCNVYAILQQLTEGKAQGAVKATASCGSSLGAALGQVIQGMLPGHFSPLPSLVMAVIGAACCFTLARRSSAKSIAAHRGIAQSAQVV